jgi:transcriptional regulator with XRE-family HTH domain
MIGVSLKAAREHHGLTQVQAADLLGVHQATYDGYENRGRLPGDDVLERMVEHLGAPGPSCAPDCPHAKLAERIARVRREHRPAVRFPSSAAGATTTKRTRARRIKFMTEAAERAARLTGGRR